MRQIQSLLSDFLEALEAIEEQTQGITYEFFLADRLRRTSVYWHLTILGESANKLLKVRPEFASQIPEFERLISVRHRIVHSYFQIDDRTIWAILTERLPGLADRIRSLMSSENSVPTDDLTDHE